MADQTKMIIITSNEDIIRQFSFNKTVNTHIIDLDNTEQMVSNDNNMINLALLAQLCQPNLNSDESCKRVLDSSDQNPSKLVKTTKKSSDMICAVCGGQANGFHYDALTCASCKAFFRRNANQNMDKLRCLKGQGQCSFTHETQRKCPKCRLERCFSAGMRKDFIQTEEEKQRKQIRLEENRNMTLQHLSTSESFLPTSDEVDSLLMDMDKINDNICESNGIEDLLFGTLSVEDWLTIHSVQSSFVSFLHLPREQFTNSIDLSDRTSALISWSEFGNQLALRFINFFRQINEFQDLNLDDRTVLIKYNLLPVFPICKCYNYIDQDYDCSYGSNEKIEKHRRFFTLCGESYNIPDAFINLMVSLVQITEQDPTLLSLLLIILILTPGLSMNEEEPPLKDSLAVNRAQSHYTKIFWNYLVNQGGEIQACKRFTQLLAVILRMQSATKEFRRFLRNQYIISNTVDKLGPLMQSVLHIS